MTPVRGLQAKEGREAMKTEELREHWQRAAPRWRANRAFVRTLTAPVTRALMESADPRPGERWLDVAGGVGDPAVEIVERVEPDGVVVVSDLVHAMVATARETIESERGRRVPALVMAAERSALGDGAVDGITCRYGAMFFADPDAAFSALRRAVRPGGRGVFAVWSESVRNPFFRDVNEAIRLVVPDHPAPEPDDPHVFRFAARGKLARALEKAGWSGIEERALPFEMAASVERIPLWDRLTRLSRELDELAHDLPERARSRLREEIETRLGRWIRNGEMRLPAETRIVTAIA